MTAETVGKIESIVKAYATSPEEAAPMIRDLYDLIVQAVTECTDYMVQGEPVSVWLLQLPR